MHGICVSVIVVYEEQDLQISFNVLSFSSLSRILNIKIAVVVWGSFEHLLHNSRNYNSTGLPDSVERLQQIQFFGA